MSEPLAQPVALPYVPKKIDRQAHLKIRDVHYRVREWGEQDAPLVFFLHGWMDVAASFQFVVDELKDAWHVVAPDWRGYGDSGWSSAGCYWLPDYLADFDQLLEHFSPAEAALVVGHSMGGNIAVLYAGVRSQRIRAVVNLEGLGLSGDVADKAPARLAKWLAQLRDPPTLRTYESRAEVVARLRKTNPRLTPERAWFLADLWSRARADGRFEILGDPAHKIVNPYLYRADEAAATWKSVTAPVLWVMARDSEYARRMTAVPGYLDRINAIANVEQAWIDDAGHMMHHDQPKRVAEILERFLKVHRPQQAAPAHGPG